MLSPTMSTEYYCVTVAAHSEQPSADARGSGLTIGESE